jgi:hypothetical protein
MQLNHKRDSAHQIQVTPHAARPWLTGVFIPKEQYMQALAQLLKVAPSWLRYGDVLEDSFIADYLLAFPQFSRQATLSKSE